MENVTVVQKQKGLSGFAIKIIALVLMVFDHIHYFFDFTGVVPLWFCWLGRLAGWLFLFMVVEGFVHTSNRKKYFLRLWGMSAAMGVANYLIMIFLPRGDGFVPQNNIFATFALLVVLWQGIDWLRKKRWALGLAALLGPVALLFGLTALPQNIVGWVAILPATVLPLPMLTEGGIPYLIGGLVLYLLHKHRGWQVGIWALVVILWNVFSMFLMGGFSVAWWFDVGFEWMGVFAGLFMLAYNGQRGRSAKRLFYVFYPAHVYVFYAASLAVYALMR